MPDSRDAPTPQPSTARAIVLQDGQLLVVRHTVGGRSYWVFPGGYPEPGESAAVAAAREVREETGLVVRPLRVVCRGHFAGRGDEVFVLADVAGGRLEPGRDPEVPDQAQIISGVAFVALGELADFDLRPGEVRDFVLKHAKRGWPSEIVDLGVYS